VTMTLTEFLAARVAEDEADAMSGWRWKSLPAGEYDRLQARVLAECEAKRRIVEGAANEPDVNADQRDIGLWEGYLSAAELLALPYSDHPDYRPEWKP
jgi:hypothetical protein